jgi:excisionase family DNA binding protein
VVNLLKITEAAARLNVSRGHLWKMVREGKIRAVVIPSAGKKRLFRIPESEADRIMQGGFRGTSLPRRRLECRHGENHMQERINLPHVRC